MIKSPANLHVSLLFEVSCDNPPETCLAIRRLSVLEKSLVASDDKQEDHMLEAVRCRRSLSEIKQTREGNLNVILRSI